MAPKDFVSTTDPDLTVKPIPEDQREYFLEEIGVYCDVKKQFIYSQLWKCFCCEENQVKNYGSKCSKCLGFFNRKRPFERTYNKAKKNAPREKMKSGIKIEFLISFEDFVDFCLIPDCDYCGVFLNRAEHEGCDGTVAMLLDRKDSNEHYTKENCVPCCAECNALKGEKISYDEMHLIMAFRKRDNYLGKSESSKAG